MNKTEARRLVKKRLAAGHFQGVNCVYARCPKCSVDVTGYYQPWDLPREQERALADAMFLHLMDEHGDDDAPA